MRALIWTCCVLLLVCGCRFKGEASPPPSSAATPTITSSSTVTTHVAWVPQPVQMRIYPTTRFILLNETGSRDAKKVVLEARIEFLDEMQDPVKGAGTFSFELVDVPNLINRSLDVRLYQWDHIELLSLEHQQKYYDQISRGYMFRLDLTDNTDSDEDRVEERRTMVRVHFKPANGPRLEAELIVPTNW